VLGPDLAGELSGDDAPPGSFFKGLAWGCALELAAGLVLVAAVVLLAWWLG